MRVRSTAASIEYIKGGELLISYDTPVAYDVGSIVYVVSKKYSVTTSRHINDFAASLAAKSL